MSWLSSGVVSVLSGGVGLLLAGAIANTCVSWYHVSSREGASGYFVIFIGLAGGVAGLILGLVTARLVASHFGPGFLKELGGALGVVLLIAGISLALARWLADVPPTIDGQRLVLEVEFRFPAASQAAKPPTADGEWKFWLGSLSGHRQRAARDGRIMTESARLEEGRWIVPAKVDLFTERGQRTVTLQPGSREAVGFLVSLPSRPGRAFEAWSDWMPRQSGDGQPWPADRTSYRFRVQKVAPTPAADSYAQAMAEEAARDEAGFAALAPDAPLERWLPYLYKTAQAERAMAAITNRPNLIADLTGLVTGDNDQAAAEGLRLVEKVPHPSTAFIAPVQAAGRELAERMRKVNATPVAEDPSYQGAAYVSIRFNGWMTAVRALREKCGGDFTPELRTILELSRARPDSQVLQVDVCRVASFYLSEWAGVAPLPSDPKPR